MQPLQPLLYEYVPRRLKLRCLVKGAAWKCVSVCRRSLSHGNVDLHWRKIPAAHQATN